jgi:erythrocyte band 7 integral membrane protein
MVITAEAQVKAAELMRKAADMLSTDGAMQIRGLEVIERLASSPNAKMIFIPSNFGPQQGNSQEGAVARTSGLPANFTINTN